MSLGLRPYLEDRISPEPNSGCWLWAGGWNERGYGVFYDETFEYKAHRIVYIILRGPIPKGFELDHLCRNKCCCNPDHLEAVTHQVNVQRGNAGRYYRGDACPKGHPYTEENTYRRNGVRACRTCRRAANSRHNAKRRNKA